MAWITPTEADILTRLSGAEMQAFRSAALGTGQADPVAAQIVTVVNFMRGYLRRCSQHTMGAAGTIPAEGLNVFLDLIVPIIQQRPAGALIDSSGIRMDARSDANKWLSGSAKCEILFDDSVPAQQPDRGPVLSPSFEPRRRTRGRIDG